MTEVLPVTTLIPLVTKKTATKMKVRIPVLTFKTILASMNLTRTGRAFLRNVSSMQQKAELFGNVVDKIYRLVAQPIPLGVLSGYCNDLL